MKNDDVAQLNSTVSQRSIEEVVIRIWKELLGLQDVCAADNFLLLGGESLLATQAAARLKDAYGLEVPLRAILVGTVAEVAAQLASALQTTGK
jgi:acyl carrier protein